MKLDLRQTSCPVCGSENAQVLFKDINRRESLRVSSSYQRCSSCSTIYLNPTLDESSFCGFDEVYAAQRPHRRHRKLGYLIGGINNNSIHGWLHRLPDGSGAGKRILDIGCSSGEKLETFKKRGFEVHGIDMAADAIKRANERFGGGFTCGRLEDAHCHDDYFDAVRIDSTLEHIQRPRELLEEVRRILKPGGIFLIYVPNGDSLSVRLLKGYSINSWIPFHVVLYSPKTLRGLLSKAGFVGVETFSHTPPALLLSSVSQLLGKEKAVDLGVTGQLVSASMLPVSLVLSLFPRGEEVVGIAKKPPIIRGRH